MYAAKTLGRGQIAVCDDVAPVRRDIPRMPAATAVEVRERFRGGWSGGFDVETATPGGYRLRRTSDNHVLPGEFAGDAVRRVAPRR